MSYWMDWIGLGHRPLVQLEHRSRELFLDSPGCLSTAAGSARALGRWQRYDTWNEIFSNLYHKAQGEWKWYAVSTFTKRHPGCFHKMIWIDTSDILSNKAFKIYNIAPNLFRCQLFHSDYSEEGGIGAERREQVGVDWRKRDHLVPHKDCLF